MCIRPYNVDFFSKISSQFILVRSKNSVNVLFAMKLLVFTPLKYNPGTPKKGWSMNSCSLILWRQCTPRYTSSKPKDVTAWLIENTWRKTTCMYKRNGARFCTQCMGNLYILKFGVKGSTVTKVAFTMSIGQVWGENLKKLRFVVEKMKK